MNYKKIDTFSDWTKDEKDQFTVSVIKGLVIDGVRKANSGHPGGPMSLADFSYILYSEYLIFDTNNPDWHSRDRFVLSAGHTCMLLYVLLYLSDFLTMNDLKEFRQLHSRTPGHPEIETPGVDANTGPLGQGVGMATGMALAERMLSSTAQKNRENFTYVLVGDGDLQEPISIGAATLAGHWKLSKLVMFYDKNDIQIAGKTSRCDSTNYADLFKAMNWDVQEIDGHDHKALRKAIENAQASPLPSIIIGNTIIAKGSITLENTSQSHGAPFSPEEIIGTRKKLGLPENESFYCPDEVKKYFQRNFKPIQQLISDSDKRKDSDKFDISSELKNIDLVNFDSNEVIATRKAFGMSLDKFSSHIPTIVGGSADLDGSNCTTNFANTHGDFSSTNLKGRNIPFGVREFPMGAIMNGISLYRGLFPFGGTFLVFSDYVTICNTLICYSKITCYV